jgi:hypothetical protein
VDSASWKKICCYFLKPVFLYTFVNIYPELTFTYNIQVVVAAAAAAVLHTPHISSLPQPR